MAPIRAAEAENKKQAFTGHVHAATVFKNEQSCFTL
jgi:hypothetical protein